MSVARFHVGDVFEQMATIPDGSVDLVVTSPPFLALRSYLPADHPDKGKEIGSESTPAAFLSTLLALTREWRRVLAPHGSICVELGDTYAGGGAIDKRADTDGKITRKDYANRPSFNHGSGTGQMSTGAGWPLDKSLCLLPTLYPASLAYGRNLLDPDDRIDPLRVRNLVVWHRPNPPVGALGDKVRPSTSYVTIACMRRDRWFDLDAERQPYMHPDHPKVGKPTGYGDDGRGVGRSRTEHPAGAPPLDHWQFDENEVTTWKTTKSPGSHTPETMKITSAETFATDVGPSSATSTSTTAGIANTTTEDPAEHLSWTIPTQPYAGSHYATFPIALPRRLIRLMCPQHVCRQCGEPRRRITETTNAINKASRRNRSMADRKDKPVSSTDFPDYANVVTLGWSDCGHDDYRRGKVLDPFAGSGTTGSAATEQARDAILIDLDERNLDLARQRIGLFFEEAV